MTIEKKDVAVAGLTAAVAAVAGAQAATAADVIAPEPYVHDWSGGYIGLAAGMILGGDFPINFTNEYDAGNDFIWGGFVGVNHQFEGTGFVLGGELALQSGFDGDSADSDEEYEVDYVLDGKLKLGFAMDEFMVYIFGGPSLVASNLSDASNDGDYGNGAINWGIGADWMVWEQFSIGAEFLGRTVIAPYGWADQNNDDKTHYQGMLRAAFHFGP
jgi:opacity protein-like surface antigen